MMGISQLPPNVSDPSGQVSIDLVKQVTIFPGQKDPDSEFALGTFVCPLLNIAFSSNPDTLAGADRFCCIVRAMKVETFPSVTKNTGCCFHSIYKKQMPFFTDPTD